MKTHNSSNKILQIVISYSLVVMILLIVTGVTVAAFLDKGKVMGSTFSVGNSDIKLLSDVSKGPNSDNLAEELTGPTFSNIGPNWSSNYLLKVYNNGTTPVTLSSNSNYETANDPDDLRQIVYVEPFAWNDSNSNGVLDTGETGSSFGKKTIIKWKTEGYAFGQLDQGHTQGIILKFSTDAVSETKQGKSGIFDFEFNSTSI